MKKIMVVSVNAWDDTNSLGNTISNFFGEWEDTEFLSLYFRSALPYNNVCKRYYQINEKMMLKGFINPKACGKYFEYNREKEKAPDAAREQKLIAFFHRFNISFIYRVIDFLWSLGSWKNKKFKECIKEFSPDIVFAFAKSEAQDYYALKYIKENTNAKLILFCADDVYTIYKSKKNRYGSKLAKRFQYLMSAADKIYGISPQICEYYQKEFKRELPLLQKGCTEFSPIKEGISGPVKIVYAGNFHYGRFDFLCEISRITDSLRKKGIPIEFELYSGDYLPDDKKEKLENSSTRFMGCRRYEELEEIFKQSDIVLHAESFEREEIEKVKMSFSTKIIDCLKSGCTLLVIGPEEIASVECAKNIPGAYVIDNKEKIEAGLENLISDRERLRSMAQETRAYAMENYHIDAVRKRLHRDFEEILEN